MGTNHSTHTNLGDDSTCYKAGANGSKARWGDSFEVGMSKWNENDNTNVWGVEYKTGQKNRTCGFQLKASYDNHGIESINFGLRDIANNKTEFALKITRIERHTLHGGITGMDSSASPISFTRTNQDYLIETTIVSYSCSYREGLFVLEMKKKGKSKNACIVNVAHYYITKDVGLSVSAKIFRNKANGFVVEVEGPFKHPSVDLRKVVDKTCSSGVWSPNACSHCKRTTKKASIGVKSGDLNSNNSLLKDDSHVQESDGKIGEIVKHGLFSSSVREQVNIGLINSSGYTSGTLNNSIVFMDCNFKMHD